MIGRACGAAFLLAALVACHAGKGQDDDLSLFDPSRVVTVVERLIAADNAADLVTILDCYSQDAMLLAPDGSTCQGRDAIRAHYVDVFAKQKLELKVAVAETRVGGQGWAWQRGEVTGAITPKDGSAAKAAHDRYVMILELDEGDRRWRVSRLIWGPTEGH